MSRTSPSTYGNRDLLLLTQLLHTSGLIDPDSITPDNKLVARVGRDWFAHHLTQLSRQREGLTVDSPLSPEEVVELYQNLLAENELCKNTTDLANKFYFARIDELTTKIDEAKQSFPELIEG